jgi:hypothetical protein
MIGCITYPGGSGVARSSIISERCLLNSYVNDDYAAASLDPLVPCDEASAVLQGPETDTHSTTDDRNPALVVGLDVACLRPETVVTRLLSR